MRRKKNRATDARPCVGADWVMSLEVAEHIPPQFTDAFLRNVRCHARVGAVISWALPSQRGGLGHTCTRGAVAPEIWQRTNYPRVVILNVHVQVSYRLAKV